MTGVGMFAEQNHTYSPPPENYPALQAAALNVLADRDALDLAEMLGVAG